MTTPPVHKDLASGRWHTLTLVEQMGNIGSEVHRAFRARERRDAPRAELAFARALELFDLSAGDARWHGARRREQRRARELFCGAFLAEPGDACATDDAGFLDRYFLQFAVAARR